MREGRRPRREAMAQTRGTGGGLRASGLGLQGRWNVELSVTDGSQKKGEGLISFEGIF